MRLSRDKQTDNSISLYKYQEILALELKSNSRAICCILKDKTLSSFSIITAAKKVVA